MEAFKPDISVVIPYYNSDSTIHKALASIARQTYLPTEVIIVDDGSLAERAAERHIKQDQYPFPVRIIHQVVNKGAPAARNLGKDAAKGSFIAFLDSDDAWTMNKLETQLPVMILTKCDLIYTEYSELFPGDAPSIPDSGYIRNIRLIDILKKNLSPVTLVIRKDLSILFDNRLRRCDDFKFSIDALAEGKKIVKIDVPYSYGFKHAIGESGLTASMCKMSGSFLRACFYISKERRVLVPWMIVFVLFEIVKFPLRYLRIKVRNAYKYSFGR